MVASRLIYRLFFVDYFFYIAQNCTKAMRQSIVFASFIAGFGVTMLTSVVPNALAGDVKQSAPANGFTAEEYKIFVDSCVDGATKPRENGPSLSQPQAQKACGCVADEMNKQPRSFLEEMVTSSVNGRDPNSKAQATMSQIINSCKP